MTGSELPWRERRLHFVGIGGAGMSGVAIVAHGLGATVTGSDLVDTPYCRRLREQGIEPTIGYDAANVPVGAELVYGSAILPDNPERLSRKPASQLHRADLLAQICSLRRCLTVTGTHGKTTTTSMAVQALRGAGMDPSYVVGAELRATGVNAALGTGEWIVVEADESDRSLLKLTPEVAILTNAELDHHATYSSFQDLEATFAEFMAKASGGAVVWDRPQLRALCPDGGIPDAADAVSGPAGTTFNWRGNAVTLMVPGVHNAVNAAGALTACALTGADPAAAIAALAEFRGARRRMELLGRTPSGAVVYDDYAHHPTEVATTVAAARSLQPRRVVAVFQPHLFSRTHELAHGFGQALADADLVVVVPIYPARERAEDFPGVDGRLVAAAAADAWPGRRPVAWMPSLDDGAAYLRGILRDGDLCLVMGAGNVDTLGRALLA